MFCQINHTSKRKWLQFMNNANDSKELFLSFYKQLGYDYQCIVLNTFKCLVTYDDTSKTGYKPYDISGIIKHYQTKKGYTDQQVCDKVNNILESDTETLFLDIDTYRKIKYRNTQSSKSKTNWLSLIAKVLDFEQEEYHKYLSAQNIEFILQHSNEVTSIDTLYDQLSTKEKSAILQLTVSLFRLHTAPECTTSEYQADEYVDNQE